MAHLDSNLRPFSLSCSRPGLLPTRLVWNLVNHCVNSALRIFRSPTLAGLPKMTASLTFTPFLDNLLLHEFSVDGQPNFKTATSELILRITMLMSSLTGRFDVVLSRAG